MQGPFFAIPSNTVQKITGQLIASGKVVYPYMGVRAVPVMQDVAAQAGLTVNYGLYVADVSPGGPAANAAIQMDDVLLEIDGTKIEQQHSFSEVLFASKPGDKVDVMILREGKQITVSVTLGERPPSVQG